MGRPIPEFHGFIGQSAIVEPLRRQIAGAIALKTPFPPTRFIGPSGSGKTLLARAAAKEYGTGFLEGHGCDPCDKFVEKLLAMKTGDFLFVDECHCLSNDAQEMFYEVIDKARILRTLCKPTEDKDKEKEKSEIVDPYVSINPVTILFATNRPGDLLPALEKRIAISFLLSAYSIPEMRAIVDRIVKTSNLRLSSQARNLLASASGGLPRRAKQLALMLKLHYPKSTDPTAPELRVGDVRKFLNDFQIDDEGLGIEHQRYLEFLNGAESASLEMLASQLGVDKSHVHHEIEFRLVQLHLVQIGSRGRQLTHAGRKYIADRIANNNEAEDVNDND